MKISSATRAVITGAGSGLGRELALQLAKRGAKIWATDINLANAEATAAICKRQASVCDVRKPVEVEKLANDVRVKWGSVDLLVNNAGVAVGGAFEDQSLEDWQWIMETNLWGVIYGCHYFYPIMKSNGGGTILNIASAAGLLSPPHLASYNVTKAGVVALTESLHAESDLTKVYASVACPTFFMSGLLGRARIKDPRAREEAKKIFAEKSFSTAQSVAASCIRAIERRQLYALPSWDGRLLWRMKRLVPGRFSKIVTAFLPKPEYMTKND